MDCAPRRTASRRRLPTALAGVYRRRQGGSGGSARGGLRGGDGWEGCPPRAAYEDEQGEEKVAHPQQPTRLGL